MNLELLIFISIFLQWATCFPVSVNKTVRYYYIAAEEQVWDYAPMHWDNFRDQPLTKIPSVLYTVHRKNKRIGSEYVKAVYRQYRDATFTSVIAHDSVLGNLGPIIRAEAGDQIQIVFMNKARYPHSLHPHQNSNVSLPGEFVMPNETYTYVWDIPANYAFPENQSSVLWAYSSRSNPIGDVNAGLLGVVVIYKKGTLIYPSPGSMFQSPQGVDQEVFTIMTNTNENDSTYFLASAERKGISESRVKTLYKTDPLFYQSNRMFHINGYVFNNNKVINVVMGSRVRWYVLSFDVSDKDIHTAHWHGATVLYYGHRVDVVDLTPISFEVVDMVPDNEGQWLFHCHVSSHFEAGMTAFYQVEKVVYTGDEGWEK